MFQQFFFQDCSRSQVSRIFVFDQVCDQLQPKPSREFRFLLAQKSKFVFFVLRDGPLFFWRGGGGGMKNLTLQTFFFIFAPLQTIFL